MKNLKIIIICLVLLIIITIISIIFIKKNEYKMDPNIVIPEVPPEVKEPLERENGLGSFYLVDGLITNYFSCIINENAEENNYDAAYKILSQKFIEEKNLNMENIEQYFQEYKGCSSYITREVYKEAITKSEGLANEYLYTKGVIRKEGKIKEIYTYIIKDLNNNTYSIEFIDKETFEEKISNKDNDVEKIEILENEYNQLKVITVEEKIMCLKHMQDYKNAIKNNEEEAYYLLDEEYREKRFGSVEAYKKYRLNMQETYGYEGISDYIVNENEDYTEYVCKDNFDNMYIFTEEYPMDYKLKLDTYTIPTEKFKTEYAKSKDIKKVAMNIDKWFQMLKNKDYKNAYAVLDETFRNNNFGSEDNFEKYIKEKYPAIYTIEFLTYSEESGIYVQNIKLIDEKGINTENKETNIIMQLKEGTDFVMSFGIE